MQSKLSLCVLVALSLTAPAAAQVPDLIWYRFESGDARNDANPGVGNGTPNASVAFGPVGLCAAQPGGASSLGGSAIDTGWPMALGNSDWTIGMWLDLRTGGNAFQYVWGVSNASQFRSFLGTGGAVFLSGAAPQPTVSLPGAANTTTPSHIVYCYDSSVPEIRGYLNGVLTATGPVNGALNLTFTETLRVMTHTTIAMVAGNTIDDFRLYSRCITQSEINAWMQCSATGGGLGTSYCTPGVPNSTGASGVMAASGSVSLVANDVTLIASSLPQNSFGYFLTSLTQGNVGQPGGSQGVLCLGGSIGRFVGPGQILNSGAGGTFSLAIDNTALPTPQGPVAAIVGQAWNFQSWHRDAVGGAATSNFTDGLTITWQ
jgi:hypothetical protein